jgi:hypothetical protein
MPNFLDILGWMGAALVLLAYILLSLGKIQGGSKLYQVINLVGAIGLAANSLWKGAYPSVALNLVWMTMAAYAIFKPPRDRASSA